MSETYRRRSNAREAIRASAAAAFLSLFLGSCSLSLTGSSDEKVETTGSIRPAATTLSPDLGQEDWRRAKGALAIALDPQGSGAAVKWDNPDSRISGTITPVAQPFVKEHEICRAFLATIEFPDRSTSLQGNACRLSADDWELKDVRPWRKPA
ncbi:RT0821/Lpp0805 family surface protein [Enterovirga rhinocerotis]|uniref:Outer membrane surface antigen n=1 Tax=Enterovirga rhinocerotis TaxID=1339210 RepID=A0A4R7C7N1_9HYPH|nr:RT0821/Lpp0805 family surface protein [Enterovirga rhinocerotis]TDR94311.1 outer membrane surface antigen [Enterovirga rhinocerotis]